MDPTSELINNLRYALKIVQEELGRLVAENKQLKAENEKLKAQVRAIIDKM